MGQDITFQGYISCIIFVGATALTLFYYTESIKFFHIIDLNCIGTEQNVFNCSYNDIVQYSCTDYEDASVRCPGTFNDNY